MASIKKRADGKWRARYRDPDGREHARHFARKVDAQAYLDRVTADVVSGSYVDPRAGRVTFGRFAVDWLAAQTFEESTREQMESRLRRRILPTFGTMELRVIRPSTVQAWLRGCQEECAPKTVRVLLAHVSGILGAAVEDGLIARNPCASRSVRAPAMVPRKVIPWTGEQVAAIVTGLPEPYRALAVVAAGAGLRQGEVFGLRVDDVDFLGRRLHVRQQVKTVRGKLVLAPPKGGKQRTVPLADTVGYAIAERLRGWPAGDDGLVFRSRERKPLAASYVNTRLWKPALVAAGIEPTRENGMHAARHYYASVLLDAGESVRALADYLGHADPGFTLRVYTHLLPVSEDRARQAVDAALGPRADSLRTGGAAEG